MIQKRDYRQYFFVIRQLVKRELKRKYSRSYLGVVWSVLNPLLSMIVMSFIFSMMFKRNIENYPLYLLSGTMTWSFFTGATNAAMTAIVDNRGMLLKIKFPLMIFPLARIYTSVVNLGYTFIAYFIVFAFSQVPLSKKMIMTPVILLLMLLFIIGMSYILSVTYVFFGDMKHLYSVILQVWMYCSAIFYPVEAVPEFMQVIIKNNPIYNYIACVRKCMLYQEMPNLNEIILMFVWGIGMYTVGSIIFKKSKNKLLRFI